MAGDPEFRFDRDQIVAVIVASGGWPAHEPVWGHDPRTGGIDWHHEEPDWSVGLTQWVWDADQGAFLQ